MIHAVNDNRGYDSSRRQDQARRNRRLVLDAARRRFLRDGYTATTLTSIADDAHVSVDLIYKSFRGKSGILKTLFDVSVVGDDEPVPLLDRPQMKLWQAETDPRRLLRSYSAFVANSMVDAGPIQLLARSAAADGDAAEVWHSIRQTRLTGMGLFAQQLQNKGFLRPELTVVEARDLLWTYIGPELFESLVLERGWTIDRYAGFLTEALIAALLPPSVP